MRPIIIDMKELSESEEIYRSAPNRITVIFVYIMLAFTLISVLWMSVFSMDEVINANGMLKKREDKTYQLEIYISGQDYGNINIDQDVRFEILAYPANQYQYFHGRILNISDEPAYSSESGEIFYTVTVAIDKAELKDAGGKELSLAEGLPCRADIVLGREKVLMYLLKKL